MGLIVKEGLHDKQAEDYIERFCQTSNIKETDKLTAMTLADLEALHPGAIVGLGITESQLKTWIEKKPKMTSLKSQKPVNPESKNAAQ